MQYTLFYSWQSDLPGAATRSLIQGALEKAALSIASDDTVEVEPVIDRDTIGRPGAPDIATTIFAKIDAAEAFVCDISLVTVDGRGRPSPNPNVLIELGYAIKSLGWDRIIPVFNAAYGRPEDLPFDLRGRRILRYESAGDDKDRATPRRYLQGVFDEAIRAVIALGPKARGFEPPSALEKAINAIDGHSPQQRSAVRGYMKAVLGQLIALNPAWSAPLERDEILVAALNQSEPLVADFAKLSECIAMNGAADALTLVFEGFAPIVNCYYPPRLSGVYTGADYDFFKFLGHELFVVLFSFLVTERQWELIASVLNEQLFVEALAEKPSGGSVSFTKISEHVATLGPRDARLHRVSTHADLLKERHTAGIIADAVPFDAFMAADYLLFLRGQFESDAQWAYWRPWSVLYMNEVPVFLKLSRQAQAATKLLPAIGAASIEQVRVEILDRTAVLSRFYKSNPFFDGPLDLYEPTSFGSS